MIKKLLCILNILFIFPANAAEKYDEGDRDHRQARPLPRGVTPSFLYSLASDLYNKDDETSHKKAREYFYLLSENENSNAQNMYGCMLYNGKGGEVDHPQARYWFRRSAEGGDVTAQKNYAMMLQSGKGGEVDLVQAREWYRRSAEGGNIDASYSYAKMLYFGEGGPEDQVEARRWYEVVAKSGHKDAQRDYAITIENGHGGEVDLAQAREWYRRSAEGGNIDAHFDYAMMLQNGRGGDTDFNQAREWYKRGADASSVRCLEQYMEILRKSDREEDSKELEEYQLKAVTLVGNKFAEQKEEDTPEEERIFLAFPFLRGVWEEGIKDNKGRLIVDPQSLKEFMINERELVSKEVVDYLKTPEFLEDLKINRGDWKITLLKKFCEDEVDGTENSHNQEDDNSEGGGGGIISRTIGAFQNLFKRK